MVGCRVVTKSCGLVPLNIGLNTHQPTIRPCIAPLDASRSLGTTASLHTFSLHIPLHNQSRRRIQAVQKPDCVPQMTLCEYPNEQGRRPAVLLLQVSGQTYASFEVLQLYIYARCRRRVLSSTRPSSAQRCCTVERTTHIEPTSISRMKLLNGVRLCLPTRSTPS